VRAGLDFLFRSQYPSGGWPQRWPLDGSYKDHATLNDDVHYNNLRLLDELVAGDGRCSNRGDVSGISVTTPHLLARASGDGPFDGLNDTRAAPARARAMQFLLDAQVTTPAAHLAVCVALLLIESQPDTLAAQIVVGGQRTVWAAQHDPVTLEPRHGRDYEPAGFGGGESRKVAPKDTA